MQCRCYLHYRPHHPTYKKTFYANHISPTQRLPVAKPTCQKNLLGVSARDRGRGSIAQLRKEHGKEWGEIAGESDAVRP